MQGRTERIIIPGAVTLTSTIITLWVTAGLSNSPLTWFHFAQSKIQLPGLLGLLAASFAYYGLGYLCHGIYTTLMLWIQRIRFINFDSFMRSFNITFANDLKEKAKKEIRKHLKEPLLAEFHARLHSHAPDKLLDHCSRRNSGQYINQGSSIALLMGCIVGFLIINSSGGMCSEQKISFFIVSLITVAGSAALFYVGYRWNREFWEVAWKWIEWDRKEHGLPEDWYKALPVEYESAPPANDNPYVIKALEKKPE